MNKYIQVYKFRFKGVGLGNLFFLDGSFGSARAVS